MHVALMRMRQLPNRLNYVHWIEELVETLQPEDLKTLPTPVHGRDIGTGTLAVYAVLASALHRDWHMTGTDVDAEALDNARAMLANVANNTEDRTGTPPGTKGPLRLGSRISLVHTRPDDPLLGSERYHFTMCNPPFYDSAAEREQSAAAKATPHGHSEGSAGELYTAGGERAFVARLVAESAAPGQRDRVAWYTTMVGKRSSLLALVAYLKKHHIHNYGVREFIQGKTRRWGVAWSYRASRLPDSAARTCSATLASTLPPSNVRQLHTHMARDGAAALFARLRDSATLPPSEAHVQQHGDKVVLCTISPCWQRGARRARKRAGAMAQASKAPERADSATQAVEVPARTAPPVLKVTLRPTPPETVRVEWTYGHDRVLFDSLCMHLQGILRQT